MKRFVFLLWAAWAASVVLAQEMPAATPEAVSADGPTVVPAAAPADVPAETPLLTPVPAPVDAQAVTPVVAPAVPAPVAAEGPSGAVPQRVTDPAPRAAAGGRPAPPLPLVPAGRWDGDVHAAATASFGNTSGQSLNLGADAVYQHPGEKLTLSAQYLESSARSVTNGVVTTSLTTLQWRVGGRYDQDITDSEFGFIGLDFSQDQILQLALRSVISTGIGRHLVKSAQDEWDVFGGVTYREDLYAPPGIEIDGVRQMRFDSVESLVGEESNHKLADTARVKQKFVIYPGLGNGKGTRATFDAGLQLDINKTLSLNMTLQGRYDSLAEAPAEKYDVLFMTGLSIRFGG